MADIITFLIVLQIKSFHGQILSKKKISSDVANKFKNITIFKTWDNKKLFIKNNKI